jgi:hypothetical protein
VPYITPFGFEGEANSGDSVQLTCYVAKGDGPLSILWSFQGKDSSTVNGVMTTKIGDRTSLLTIASVVAGHGGEYTCTARNAGGSANHSAVLLVNGIVLFMLSVCTICSSLSIYIGVSYTSPSVVGVKNEWKYTSTPPCTFLGCTGTMLYWVFLHISISCWR